MSVVLTRPIQDQDVADSITLTDLVKSFGVLPRAGGILDQDWYHIALLRAGYRAIDKLEVRRQAEQEAKARMSKTR